MPPPVWHSGLQVWILAQLMLSLQAPVQLLLKLVALEKCQLAQLLVLVLSPDLFSSFS